LHFSIRHLTECVYEAPASDNLNALVRPATTSTQRNDEFTGRREPEASAGRDRGAARATRRRLGGPWTNTYAEAAGEYLLAALDEPETAFSTELVAAVHGGGPLETVRAAVRRHPRSLRLPVARRTWAPTRTCQDYVHLGLILLRRNGIAARYVSGYL
jgi:hypothetical protein